jgi:putative transposase
MLSAAIGERRACVALGASRATMQRRKKPLSAETRALQPRKSHRRLSDAERTNVLDIIHSERFCDFSVREIFATLLDEGTYLCSISTMYRTLRSEGESKERRPLAHHRTMQKPELEATATGQVWHGPQKWTYYYLYVVLDIFSRYVVAWRLERRECAGLACEMFEAAIAREGVDPARLTIHADGGSAMTAKSTLQLFTDLGVIKSRSRPHVSNDNPFSEAQFKTTKYHRTFPTYFANIEQARAYMRAFIEWYNNVHYHAGLALLRPVDVHSGRVDERVASRNATLAIAYERHPERFVKRKPIAATIEGIVYINRPEDSEAA